MTKYYKDNFRTEIDKEVPIAILGEKFTKKDKPRYICPECRLQLTRLSEEEYWCGRDHLSFYPNEDNIRTASKVSMPRTTEENPPLVAHGIDANEQYLNKDKVEPQGAFKLLQDRGLKITSYTETGSDGRPLKKSRWL